MANDCSGAVAWWKFPNNGGAADGTDFGTNGLDLTPINAPVSVDVSGTTKAGPDTDGDGYGATITYVGDTNNKYFTHADNALIPGSDAWTPGSFTVSGWFYPTNLDPAAAGSTVYGIMGKWSFPDNPSGLNRWLLYHDQDGDVTFTVDNGTETYWNATIATAITTEKYWRITARYDHSASTVELRVTGYDFEGGVPYLDTPQDSGTTGSAVCDAADAAINFIVGVYYAHTRCIAGHLDDWAIFDSALSDADVALLEAGTYGAGATDILVSDLECTTELETVQISAHRGLTFDAIECVTAIGTVSLSEVFVAEGQAYSAVATASLPTGASVFTDYFTEAEYTSVETAEGTYAVAGVDYYEKSCATGQYVVVNFFEENNYDTTKLAFDMPMKSTYDPSGSNVILQLFKCSDQSWNTKYTESTAVANEEFFAFGSHAADLTEFYFQKLKFVGGATTVEPTLNETITGGLSGHSGEYVGYELESGSWGSNPAGYLHLYDCDGVFQAAETITGASFTGTVATIIDGKYWSAWRVYQEAA